MWKFFFQLQNGVEHNGKIYTINAHCCVKVEFHESRWVHYHVIFLTHRFLPKGLLAELANFASRLASGEHRLGLFAVME